MKRVLTTLPLTPILLVAFALSAAVTQAAPAVGKKAAARPATAALVISQTNSEAQCLQVLQSDAAPVEKDAACARLKLVGTDRSIPALAALLGDEQLSHTARLALEPMSSPAAGRALIAALDHTSGLTKSGIIDSLGVRREADAVPALAKALADQDAVVAVAAATALGEVGNAKALSALQSVSTSASAASFSFSASPSLARAVVDAQLRCANRFLAAGDLAKARDLFQRLYDSAMDDSIRVATFRGVIFSSGKQALDLAGKAILGEAGPAQLAALQSVHELKVSGASAAFAKLLPQVGPPIQVALIGALSQRNDPAAIPGIVALARNPAAEVRFATIQALGDLGDGAQVSLLAEIAASTTGAEQAAAREALVALRRGKPADALIGQLPAAAPAVQAEIARALGARGDRAAVPRLLTLAKQGSDSARAAAVLALAQTVDQAELASLVDLVVAAKTEAACSQAAEALNSACQNIQSRRGKFDVDPLVKGLGGAPLEARLALLQVCAGFNDPKVRAALRAAVRDPNPQLHAGAVRALCGTLDPELLPDLVKLACSAPEENLRTLAIAACVRLNTQEETVAIPNAQRVETFKAILAASPNLEQKRKVLAGVAEVADPGALRLAEPMLAEPAIQLEAARAIVRIASLLPDPAPAREALNKVIAAVQDEPARQAAQAVLKQSRTGNGFFAAWQVAGPYQQAGRDYNGLFDFVFAPEQPDAAGVRWQPLSARADARSQGTVDLLKALGGHERAAYARTWIRSERRQPVRLELGSDDGIKVWLNQKQVFSRNVARAVRAASDKVDVTLEAGWNSLLLKITQHDQGWGFCVRCVGTDGAPVEGLQVDARTEGLQANGAQPAGEPTAAPAPAAPTPKPDGTFTRLQLTDKFWAEGADLGDFNRDGKMDVVSGPFWYEGPDYKKAHEIWPATNSFKLTRDGKAATIPGFEGALGTKNAYSECFLTFTYDFNGDGWPDVLVIGFPAKPAYWYENPKGAGGHWPRHLVFDEVGNESPGFVDITSDGKPEILCCARGCLGYAEADWKNPTAPWTFHPISPNTKGAYQKFMHGLGAGDINGDGRLDILEKDGWWEQPASRSGDPLWTKHPFHFADAAAQLLVYDLNGDGLNDVITCLNAHGYGLAWYEQVRTNGDITFQQHIILNPDATPDCHGVSFTQPHSLALADMNGDGLADFVTGKRFWAHGKNGPDPESDGSPAVLYWFELKRPAKGQAEFIPHCIDTDSGVGTQVTVGLITGKTRPGIVVGNKKGVFVLEPVQ